MDTPLNEERAQFTSAVSSAPRPYTLAVIQQLCRAETQRAADLQAFYRDLVEAEFSEESWRTIGMLLQVYAHKR